MKSLAPESGIDLTVDGEQTGRIRESVTVDPLLVIGGILAPFPILRISIPHNGFNTLAVLSFLECQVISMGPFAEPDPPGWYRHGFSRVSAHRDHLFRDDTSTGE